MAQTKKVTCGSCFAKVNRSEETCPNCGAEVLNMSDGAAMASMGGIIVVALLLLWGFFSWIGGPGEPPTPWHEEESTLDAYVMTQQFVEERLKAPGSAEWPGVSYRDAVTHLGDQRYRTSTYVDSQNSFGAMLRTHFVAEVEQTSEDKWRLVSFEVQP